MYEKIDSIFIIDCRRRAVFGDGVGLLWFGPAHLQGEPAHRTVRLQNTERYCTQRRDRIANLRFSISNLELDFFSHCTFLNYTKHLYIKVSGYRLYVFLNLSI